MAYVAPVADCHVFGRCEDRKNKERQRRFETNTDSLIQASQKSATRERGPTGAPSCQMHRGGGTDTRGVGGPDVRRSAYSMRDGCAIYIHTRHITLLLYSNSVD